MRSPPTPGTAWLACLVASIGLGGAGRASGPALTPAVATAPLPAARAPAALTAADLEQMALVQVCPTRFGRALLLDFQEPARAWGRAEGRG
jgi:hypothetical protein